jgi:putative oxidoreductase
MASEGLGVRARSPLRAAFDRVSKNSRKPTEMKMLNRILAPLGDPVYAAMRIVVGLLFAFHGIQKIFGVFTEFQPPVGSQLWIGGVIEIMTGLLIAVGILTTWAAFLASGTMAVAYIQYHWKFNFGSSFFPAVNQGELAVVYALLFLYIACRGAGAASIAGIARDRQ